MYIKSIDLQFQSKGPLIGQLQTHIHLLGSNTNTQAPSLNPKDKLTTKEILSNVLNIQKKSIVHSLSFGGGEPLLQIDALKELLPHLKQPIYLETNGTLSTHLEEISPHIHYLYMMIQPAFVTESIAFLQVLKESPTIKSAIGYTVTKQFQFQQLQEIVKIVSHIYPEIPVYLEPIPKFSGNKDVTTTQDLIRAFTYCQKHLPNIWVIPDIKHLFEN